MSKNQHKATFKHYNPEQLSLLPPSLDELIVENHVVRVVRDVIDKIKNRHKTEQDDSFICPFGQKMRKKYESNKKQNQVSHKNIVSFRLRIVEAVH